MRDVAQRESKHGVASSRQQPDQRLGRTTILRRSASRKPGCCCSSIWARLGPSKGNTKCSCLRCDFGHSGTLRAGGLLTEVAGEMADIPLRFTVISKRSIQENSRQLGCWGLMLICFPWSTQFRTKLSSPSNRIHEHSRQLGCWGLMFVCFPWSPRPRIFAPNSPYKVVSTNTPASLAVIPSLSAPAHNELGSGSTPPNSSFHPQLTKNPNIPSSVEGMPARLWFAEREEGRGRRTVAEVPFSVEGRGNCSSCQSHQTWLRSEPHPLQAQAVCNSPKWAQLAPAFFSSWRQASGTGPVALEGRMRQRPLRQHSELATQ